MSDSDEEFFFNSQLPETQLCTDERKSKDVSLGSDSFKVSLVEYFFLVTFNWDLLAGHPFQMSVLEVLTDFPEEWIKGPLKNPFRLQKRRVMALGGGQYSLFCKVQKGCIHMYIYCNIYILNNNMYHL